MEKVNTIEAMIKKAITTLNEIPGSTFNSIKKYVNDMYGKTAEEKVLNTMKVMKKKGRLMQIKYYFRLPIKKSFNRTTVNTMTIRSKRRYSVRTDESSSNGTKKANRLINKRK